MDQDHLLPVILSKELTAILPSLRVHAFLFEGARIGVGHAGLDPLRQRVVARVDEAVQRHGDVDSIPNVQAISELLDALGQDPARDPATLRDALQAMILRRPFPVENDARDAAFLLSLYYMAPVFLLDAAALRPPLVLLPATASAVIPTKTGPRQAKGAPVLADDEKVLRSLQHSVSRAKVIEQSRSLLLVLVDPGVETPLPPKRTAERIENWFDTLTRARLVRSTSSPE